MKRTPSGSERVSSSAANSCPPPASADPAAPAVTRNGRPLRGPRRGAIRTYSTTTPAQRRAALIAAAGRMNLRAAALSPQRTLSDAARYVTDVRTRLDSPAALDAVLSGIVADAGLRLAAPPRALGDCQFCGSAVDCFDEYVAHPGRVAHRECFDLAADHEGV